ncbi:hypothetical protein PMAYCL1PPCAC_21746, partial [Pristionchus mayeri]
TSEAMGEEALGKAGRLTVSFLTDGITDFLNTDTDATFYSRVGVIAMSDTATTLYNLNMTKYDTIGSKAAIREGVANMDFVSGFFAARQMLAAGKEGNPERASAREVIYYMTDTKIQLFSDDDVTKMDQFKEYLGVIIVNDFLKEGETQSPLSKNVASEGFYFANDDYMTGLQSFCKANCFCLPSKTAYAGGDTIVKAAGGCYTGSSKLTPYKTAKTICYDLGGDLVSVHDNQKGAFLGQLMSGTKSDYFWIGYEKSKSDEWYWEDGSTDPYTNWGVNEPSPAPIAKCAYVDTTKRTLPWGAGNCNTGFPYACQFAPCQVGNRDC